MKTVLVTGTNCGLGGDVTGVPHNKLHDELVQHIPGKPQKIHWRKL